MYSSPVQWSHVSVVPLWTGSRSVRAFLLCGSQLSGWGVRAIRRLGTWRQSSLHDRMVLH